MSRERIIIVILAVINIFCFYRMFDMAKENFNLRTALVVTLKAKIKDMQTQILLGQRIDDVMETLKETEKTCADKTRR